MTVSSSNSDAHAAGGQAVQLITATASFTVCSMGMMVFNKLAVRAFPLACSLVAMQMAFTVFCLVAFCSKSLHVGSMWDLLRWCRVVPFFVGMLLTSMFALKDAPMSLVITFRALSPVLTLAAERFYPNPTSFGKGTVLALFVMCFGAGIYARGLDRGSTSSWHAIGWVLLNTALACIERLLQRLMLSKDQTPVDVSKTAASLLNNLFGMVPIALIAILTGEHLQFRSVIGAMSTLDMMWVFLSCVVGMGISFTAIWTQSLISATSMLVLTNSNKFAVILVEIFAMPGKRHLTPSQIAGAMLAIVATIFYARAREAEEKEAKQQLGTLVTEKSALMARKV
jgi:drug/metabolite transporter (DMT)-like permease